LLEGFYEATEDAGIPVESLIGSDTSVFTGCFSKDYTDAQGRDPESISNLTFGSETAMLSNRISHFYDLRGASMSIESACSSSLVALNEACQSIWAGNASISVAAGVNLLLNQDTFIGMSSLGYAEPLSVKPSLTCI
jgi:acyl transferase domain-containing protein